MSRVVVNEIEAKVGNDISFNDTVKLDTIKGKTTAGSVTVQGEGTATTNLQQGLCKTWGMVNMRLSSDYVLDSLNNASYTDHGTGEATFSFTNSFGNANYSVGYMTTRTEGSDNRKYCHLNFEYEHDDTGTAPATGSLRFVSGRGSNTTNNATRDDMARVSLNFFGDLA